MDILIGIDFSMAKPAATVMFPDRQAWFFAWPEKLTAHAEEAWSKMPETVSVKSRGIGPLPSSTPNSERVYAHVMRARALSDEIVANLNGAISCWLAANRKESGRVSVYAATEGLSFGSRGAAALDLATYKGIFLDRLTSSFGDRLASLWTYAPMTIKSVAGCSRTAVAGSKEAMISAFIGSFKDGECGFRDALLGDALKKTKGDKYIECVDDIVDSWWACRTMIAKDMPRD